MPSADVPILPPLSDVQPDSTAPATAMRVLPSSPSRFFLRPFRSLLSFWRPSPSHSPTHSRTHSWQLPDVEQALVSSITDQFAISSPRTARSFYKLAPSFPLSNLLYLLPLFCWIFLFTSGVALIPDSVKPTINTTFLPWIDQFFNHSVFWFANDGDTPVLDILAAVPYTIHPLLPLFYLVAMLITTRHHKLLQFFFVFGVMNLVAVCTHLLFPTAPPWYFIKYGTAPATYSMKGDPAVLARLDTMFSMQMYHKMYAEGGKVVFGAWPSLHAAWPYLMARYRPRLRYRWMNIFQWIYMLVVWWAAIYLQHHFAADVVGGVLYAELAIFLGRLVFNSENSSTIHAQKKPQVAAGSNIALSYVSSS